MPPQTHIHTHKPATSPYAVSNLVASMAALSSWQQAHQHSTWCLDGQDLGRGTYCKSLSCWWLTLLSRIQRTPHTLSHSFFISLYLWLTFAVIWLHSNWWIVCDYHHNLCPDQLQLRCIHAGLGKSCSWNLLTFFLSFKSCKGNQYKCNIYIHYIHT